MEHQQVLPKRPVIRYRIAALEKRPEQLALLKRVGKLSGCGKFYDLELSRADEVATANRSQRDIPVALADKVELGLCGRHREAWVAAGRPLRGCEHNAQLKQVCTGCDAKWHGMEKLLCRSQPCTVAGRWAATYQCPAGKWPNKLEGGADGTLT